MSAANTTDAPPTQPLLPFHPLADKFPLMEGADFTDLVEDIRKNGLRQEIDTYQGKIIDGRNRARACIEAGEKPRYHERRFSTEAGLVAFIISQNIHRRHLTAERKRDLLVELVKASPEKSDRQLAKEAGTTHPTIAKARKQAEATGKALPVEKRTGADGKARKCPAKKHTVEPKAKKAGDVVLDNVTPPPVSEAAAPVNKAMSADPLVEKLREFCAYTIKSVCDGHLKLSGSPEHMRRWKELRDHVAPHIEVRP
jgi:hypothetical protein